MLPQPFLSGEPRCDDLLRCVYNLSEFDLALYQRLAKKGAKKTDELAGFRGKDRSTVYRALQKLVACGMCRKETRSIERGGYYHVYSVVEPDAIKAHLTSCVDGIHRRMLDAVERLGESTNSTG